MAKLDHSKMGFLFSPLEELEAFRGLSQALENSGVYAAYGLDDSQRAHVLAGLARKNGRPLLVLTATEGAAQMRPAASSTGTISCGESSAFLTERTVFVFLGRSLIGERGDLTERPSKASASLSKSISVFSGVTIKTRYSLS